MRRSGSHRFRSARRRQRILRRVLLAVCILAVLTLCYSCAMQQLMYSSRGTMIFLPEMHLP